MTNKIVILQNSVELYEHYINDEKWEKTLSFPKGGLTYNISNGTIKFFAFEDYLYRNCLMSMQLPIYIVDEKHSIDDEYSDIGEIVDILDEIFPTNDIDAELEGYLTKREAELTYQPIGDYVTTDELDEVLDDYYTKDEADARFQPLGDYVSANTFDMYTAHTSVILDGKLDVTAYTFDPSEYYTKTEVDNKIASGGTFDPTKYYTKDNCDSRFALKSEIPSLSGYATQSWVLNKNYVTNSTLQQYIANLQEQINSLTETVSQCCGSTGETIYRWMTMTGSDNYICSGTTKYEKQVYQQSTDGGMTWQNVQPEQYRKGAVLQYNSPDCGYAPEPQYRWVNAPTSDYMCSGTTKYYKQYKEVSTDSGQSWSRVVPEETRMGGVISYDSEDCGYVTPTYRWFAANPIDDYICDMDTHTKYYKEYYQISTDNGQTWTNVVPTQTRANGIVNIHSTDCGEPHVADMLMTYKVTSGQSAHLLQGNVSLGSLQAQLDRNEWTELKVEGSGGNNPIYATFNYTANDAPARIEWISNHIHATSFSGTDLTSAAVYEGITYSQGDVWANCPYLEYLELPSTLTLMSWTFAHDCPQLKTVVLNQIEPPHLQGIPFENCPRLNAIYVPDNSVEMYKSPTVSYSTNYFSEYADIIKPLSEKP